MDLTKPSEIRELASQHGIVLTRLRGQHFLIDRGPLMSVADSADLKKTDTVLEVGPGFGTLTRELAARAGRVVAVELDKRFLPVLDETVGEFPNVRIIHGDILRLPPTCLPDRQATYSLPPDFKIVSNLPYGITSDFLWKTMAEWDPPPERLVLMLQREVGERLAAKPPRMNLLAVMAQTFGTVELIRRVPPGSYLPPPKVESAIIRIIRHRKPFAEREAILRLAKIGFSSPRKKIAGTLGKGMKDALLRAGIDPNSRPETLSLEQWRALSQPGA